MTTEQSAETLIKTITDEAKQSANADDARFIRVMEVGNHIRQGDLYITCVAKLPSGMTETTERQLAPGTSKGSRHFAELPAKVYVPKERSPLQGPHIESPERFNITHPEHADYSLPGGCYDVTHQRDFEQEEIARVAD